MDEQAERWVVRFQYGRAEVGLVVKQTAKLIRVRELSQNGGVSRHERQWKVDDVVAEFADRETALKALAARATAWEAASGKVIAAGAAHRAAQVERQDAARAAMMAFITKAVSA